MSKKMTLLLASIVVVVLSVAATALAASPSASNNSATKGHSAKTNKDFAGLVDIGGRKIYMECQGKGRPTVVFVAGVRDRAETWSTTQDPSEQAVLPAIAQTNRVCAYDRPGTLLATGDGPRDFAKSRSDPVDQPTTLQDAVSDLHALLKASGEGKRPYVLVGHSMGGAISKLYASEYPEEVSGLVLVDPTPYEAANALTAREWELLKSLIGSPSQAQLDLYPDLEWFDEQRNLEQALAAAPLKPMPLIVLSADEPLDLLPYVENGTFPTPEAAKEFSELLFRANMDAHSALVSQVPGARHITDTHSSHYIHQIQPQLVIDSVREVVEAARKKSCALGVKNHGQCVKAENHARH